MHKDKIKQTLLDEYSPTQRSLSNYIDIYYYGVICSACNQPIKPPSSALWDDKGAIHPECKPE